MNTLNGVAENLALASNSLTAHKNPTLDEVEQALTDAKTAVKILSAAVVLMGESLYTVATEPPAPGTPLFAAQE